MDVRFPNQTRQNGRELYTRPHARRDQHAGGDARTEAPTRQTRRGHRRIGRSHQEAHQHYAPATIDVIDPLRLTNRQEEALVNDSVPLSSNCHGVGTGKINEPWARADS